MTRRKAIPKQSVPKRMQAFGRSIRRHHRFRVAAIIAWVSAGEAGSRMQRLMRVADKMNTKIARHVVAIDIDPNLLEVSRLRLTEYGATNCDYVAGDADELAKLVLRPADFVFMANALHGVPDRRRLALAVRGVLRPGGLFAIVNWHQRPREETVALGQPRGPKTELRMSPEQTIETVGPSGLKLAHLVEVPPYHYGAVFERPSA